MKRILLALCMICYCFVVFSLNQWPNAVKAFDFNGINYNDASVSMGNYTICVWSESRDGHTQLFAQKIDQDGQKMWNPNGLSLCNTQANHSDQQIIKASDNTVIVIWTEEYFADTYNYYMNLKAQKIDMLGNILWSENARIIGNYFNTSNELFSYYPDNQGGFFYTKRYTNTVIHVNNQGTIVGNISLINPDNSNNNYKKIDYYPSLNKFVGIYHQNAQMMIVDFDMQGTMIHTPQVLINQSYSSIKTFISEDQEIYCFMGGIGYDVVQKLNSDFQVLFGLNGKMLSNQSFNYFDYDFSDEYQSVLLIYFIFNQGFYAQKYDYNMDAEWDAPIYLSPDTNNNNITMKSILKNDSENYVFWSDNYTLYGQKLNEDGNKLWEDTGQILDSNYSSHSLNGHLLNSNRISLISDNAMRSMISLNILDSDDIIVELGEQQSIRHGQLISYSNPPIVLEHENGCFVISQVITYSTYKKILIQYIDQSGTLLMGNTGKMITIDAHLNTLLGAKIDPNGYLNVVWYEIHNDINQYYLKTQRFDTFGQEQYNNGAVELFSGLTFSEYSSINMHFINNESYYYFNCFNDIGRNVIRGQKLIDDQVQWEPEGREIINKTINSDEFDPDNKSCKLLKNMLDEHSILWIEGQQGYFLKLNSEGEAESDWPEGGLRLFDGSGNYPYTIFAKKSGSDYVFIAYTSHYQIVNESGIALVNSTQPLISGVFFCEDINFFDQHFNMLYDQQGYKFRQFGRNNNALQTILSPVALSYDFPNETYYTKNFILNDEIVMLYRVFNDIRFQLNSKNASQIIPEMTIQDNHAYYMSNFNVNTLGHTSFFTDWIDYLPKGEGGIATGLMIQKTNLASYLDIDPEQPEIISNQLEQNYPNPFNPSTKIAYTLTSEEEIELNIYNIKGQKVNQLFKGKQDAGRHEVIWNGLDSNNHEVSAGVYFYQLKGKNQNLTRKMLMIK